MRLQTHITPPNPSQDSIEQLRAIAQREMLINRIVQSMRETLVLDEVMQTTVNLLHETLQVSRCLIFRLDHQQEMRSHYVSESTEARESLIGVQCEFYRYYASQLAAGIPLVFSEIAPHLPPVIQEAAKTCQIQAALIVPLIYQQAYIGGISLHQVDFPRPWTEEDLTLVQAIAGQCAIAIHQANLFAQLQQQAAREKLLNQINHQLNSSLDPQVVLQEIVRLTGEYFGVDRVIIFAISPCSLEVLQEWRINDTVPPLIQQKFSNSQMGDLLHPQSHCSIHQVLHLPQASQAYPCYQHQEVLDDGRVAALLRVPIRIRGELFGGLALHCLEKNCYFSDEDIQFLERMADTVAIALYNAQSYERLEKIVQERTQELENQRQLAESANRAKSEFLATMSHELRTPLTSILGFSRLLLEQSESCLTGQEKSYLDMIAKGGEHLLAVINDLLDLSTIEAGRKEIYLDTVPIEELCLISLASVRQTAEQKGLNLRLEIAPDLTNCQVDYRCFQQILINLLSNAVKFTPQGYVCLSVTQQGDSLEFTVTDTGIGISLEHQFRIFQPFQQLDSGLNRCYEGTGLGLALSQKLALLHGGDITVESELGGGARFTVSLPLQPANTRKSSNSIP